ncbi:Elicitin [Phytophthora megakarya]|uniref:Elicitin n=1 Tax=Phytophthora megakarya TaxID=4795 RepID=A0A225W310_9STRA|nr:Elicitin [Phytophthora megakarya]
MNQIVVFTLIFVSLFTQQTSAASICKQSELGSLLTNPNTTACASDSGVVFADLNGAPSDEQLTSICETDTCVSLMAAILVIDPEDCSLPLNENLNLMSELVDPVVEKCTSLGIDIVGSSRVGSDSGVNVGDQDSATSDSAGSSSSSSTATKPTGTSTTVAIAITVLTMLQ